MDYRQKELRQHQEGPEHRRHQDGTKLYTIRKKNRTHVTTSSIRYTHAHSF